jgi:hypothetical protein
MTLNTSEMLAEALAELRSINRHLSVVLAGGTSDQFDREAMMSLAAERITAPKQAAEFLREAADETTNVVMLKRAMYDVAWALSSMSKARSEGGRPVEWECFKDTSYYNFWAVRPVGQREWGKCFHLVQAEEARALTALLTKHAVAWPAEPQ